MCPATMQPNERTAALNKSMQAEEFNGAENTQATERAGSGHTLFPIDEAAAFWRAALAGDAKGFRMKVVIQSQLFATANLAATVEKNMALNLAALQVGAATMVNTLGSGAAHRPVNVPIAVQSKDRDSSRSAPHEHFF
jgi:hypothetical protein